MIKFSTKDYNLEEKSPLLKNEIFLINPEPEIIKKNIEKYYEIKSTQEKNTEIKLIKSEINKKLTEEENFDMYKNFYYYTFEQLKNIMILINTSNNETYFQGSYRLVLHLSYICRFLKEYLELNDSTKTEKYKKIIKYCFTYLFNFEWLLNENIKNKNYSHLIRYDLLTLVLSFLETYNI